MNANVEVRKQADEPFIFSLIRERLPHDDQEDEEQATISSTVVYGLMALATLGILVSWLVGGISPSRYACSYVSHEFNVHFAQSTNYQLITGAQ